jgi:hypothetical protein
MMLNGIAIISQNIISDRNMHKYLISLTVSYRKKVRSVFSGNRFASFTPKAAYFFSDRSPHHHKSLVRVEQAQSASYS